MTAIQPETFFGKLDRTGVPLIVIRLFLGGVFVWQAYSKLAQDPMVFAKAVKMYGVLPQDPPELINTVAIALPWVEMTCGVALLLGIFVRGAALLTFVMLLGFTPAIYMYGIKLFNQGEFNRLCDIVFDCGCGTGEEYFCQKLGMNGLLIIAALLGMASKSRKFCLSSLPWKRGDSSPQPNPAGATS